MSFTFFYIHLHSFAKLKAISHNLCKPVQGARHTTLFIRLLYIAKIRTSIKIFVYLGEVREVSLLGRIQAVPLSWLNFVISHSSWEASKIKSSKTNRWIIILTDYQTWASKLQLFWYIGFWISDFSIFKTQNYKTVFWVISMMTVTIMEKQKN